MPCITLKLMWAFFFSLLFLSVWNCFHLDCISRQTDTIGITRHQSICICPSV